MLQQIEEQTARIDALEKQIQQQARKDAGTARLIAIPGVSAITASAVKAFSPSMNLFPQRA